MLNFEEYLNESNLSGIKDFRKVCLLLDPAALATQKEQLEKIKDVYRVIEKATDYTSEMYKEKIPVLISGKRKKDDTSTHHEFTKELVKILKGFGAEMNEIQKLLYNPGEVMINPSADGKKKWNKSAVARKQMEDKQTWVPKTVFSKEEAEHLKFPVIGKKNLSFQSTGVEKIDSKEELKNSDFDMYQEAIDIKDEFRVVIFASKDKSKKPELIAIFRRDPLNDKAKSLRVSESKASDFVWAQLSPNKISSYGLNKNTIDSMTEWCSKNKSFSNMYGLDIAVDKEGKTWLIEINGSPVFFSNWSLILYKKIFEESYRKEISKEANDELKELSKIYASLTSKDYEHFKVEDNSSLNYNF